MTVKIQCKCKANFEINESCLNGSLNRYVNCPSCQQPLPIKSKETLEFLFKNFADLKTILAEGGEYEVKTSD